MPFRSFSLLFPPSSFSHVSSFSLLASSVHPALFSLHSLTSDMSLFLPQQSWWSWRSSSGGPEHKCVQWAVWREEDNTASSVSWVNICCRCVQGSLSVALPPPQSTPTPALATRIISSGRKSFPLVSYYSFLHQLMMSQSIHKFVVVCCFEKFDTAAGCTGMKELSGQTPKM